MDSCVATGLSLSPKTRFPKNGRVFLGGGRCPRVFYGCFRVISRPSPSWSRASGHSPPFPNFHGTSEAKIPATPGGALRGRSDRRVPHDGLEGRSETHAPTMHYRRC